MEELNYTVADMEPGEVQTIQGVFGEGKTPQRLLELGFSTGAQVRVLGVGMGGSPIRVEIDGKVAYAIRKSEACRIKVL